MLHVEHGEHVDPCQCCPEIYCKVKGDVTWLEDEHWGKSTVPSLVSILFLLVLLPNFHSLYFPLLSTLLSLTLHFSPSCLFACPLHSVLSTLFTENPELSRHAEQSLILTEACSRVGLSGCVHDSYLWICTLFISYVSLCACICVCGEYEHKHWGGNIINMQAATGFSAWPHSQYKQKSQTCM